VKRMTQGWLRGLGPTTVKDAAGLFSIPGAICGLPQAGCFLHTSLCRIPLIAKCERSQDEIGALSPAA
jgi:hypothetical protein